jgi:hypothetical protein
MKCGSNVETLDFESASWTLENLRLPFRVAPEFPLRLLPSSISRNYRLTILSEHGIAGALNALATRWPRTVGYSPFFERSFVGRPKPTFRSRSQEAGCRTSISISTAMHHRKMRQDSQHKAGSGHLPGTWVTKVLTSREGGARWPLESPISGVRSRSS